MKSDDNNNDNKKKKKPRKSPVVKRKRKLSEDDDISKYKIPSEIPIIPLVNMVVFPNVIIPLVVRNESLISLINDALGKSRIVGIFANRPLENGEFNEDEIYGTGTAAIILKMFKGEDKTSARLLVQGLSRVKISKIIAEEPYIIGKIKKLKEKPAKGLKLDALIRTAVNYFMEIIEISPNLPEDLKIAVKSLKDPSKLSDLIASNLNIGVSVRQDLLEELDLEKRLTLLSSLLTKELKLLKLSSKIQEDVDEELEKDQRDYYLREQLRAIKRELGDFDEESQELEDLYKKIEAKNLPEEAMDAAKREMKRLNRMSSASSEYTVARTYIDWLVDLPWNDITVKKIIIDRARKILDKDHFGLKDVKERILEYLAVRKLKDDNKGSIICLSGPPGVGKTSLGKSIARAMGRKFVRASLGGVRDEAEIRGHRRTYIGSMPGIILKHLRQAGVKNPVMMLDEIDKLGQSNQGDPASALLEALDPQQNDKFVDHYLDLPFDLSQVMFIMTANYLQNIPAPLLDRMEVIELPSYVLSEKAAIAKGYIVPRQIKQNGLDKKDIKFTKKALEFVIQNYTREAGVRKLEQKVEKICRKVAILKAQDKETGIKIDIDKVKEYLGNKYIIPEMANRKDEIGICTGLAWSPAGGSVLFIEATKQKGKGVVKITGQLGKVMKESAEIALSYIKSNAKKLGIKLEDVEKSDLHIHVPDGATPKDGPSAGLALTTTLVSLFTNTPIRKDIAMTGEISLHGKAMEIGGLREKVIAAQKAGIKTVLIPKDNEKDIVDIPEEVREKINFKLMFHIEDVLELALSKRAKERIKK